MKLLVNPSNKIVKVMNDKEERLKGLIVDCISMYSVMYQKQEEDSWNEIRVSYTTNPGCIIINGKSYKENAIVNILPDEKIKAFFIADTSSIALYDNGKIVGKVM